MTKILAANHVVPISSKPIRGGAVAIEGPLIAAVGTFADLQAEFPGAEIENFGEAAVLPGFVNCHSHLEVTAMRGALDSVENDFYTWLITLTKIRGEVLNDDDIKIAALAGAVEGARGGVTCFGDIGRFGTAGFEALRSTGLRGVLFQETDFSADGVKADVDFENLKHKFLDLRERQTDLVEIGISPHAPYTVSRALFEKIARFALSDKIKIAIHAGESREEDELMRHGTGFFTTVYEKFDVEWKSPLCSSIEFLSQTGILETRPILTHCITVSESDIELIALSRSSIAHCPKSNAKFGHGFAPLARFLDAEIPVGLGSDSVASNNSCDTLEEARFAAFAARNDPDCSRFLSAAQALEMATLGGAKALGLDAKIGSLEAGKQADVAVVSLADISQQPTTNVNATLVFSTNARDNRLTVVAGNEIYRSGSCATVDESRIAARMAAIGQKLRSPK